MLSLTGMALMGWLVGCGPSESPRSEAPAPETLQGERITPVTELETVETNQQAAATPATPKPAGPVGIGAKLAATNELTKGWMETNTLKAAKATSNATATVAVVTNLPPVKRVPVVLAELEKDEKGFYTIDFNQLASFEYEVPDEYPADEKEKKESPSEEVDQIPGDIRNLNERKVALQGFMLPLKVEDGLITELLIMRDQSMCCYGTVPKINEWVSVRMVNQGIKPVMDQAITLYGVLKVGEIRENGYLVGIYEMDGERMLGPLDL